MTVRAPTSGNVDNHDLVPKSRIGIRHKPAGEIRKAEVERLVRILHSRVVCRIGRLGYAGLTGLPGSYGRQGFDGGARSLESESKGSIRPRFNLKNGGARPIEVVQHELAILIVSCEGAGIAVDAQNRGRHIRAR